MQGISSKTGKKNSFLSISISKLAGAVSGAVNFLVTENITCFYFQQMLFSCSESHYFEIQGKTAI